MRLSVCRPTVSVSILYIIYRESEVYKLKILQMFGNNLKQQRKDMQMSQEKLAERCDVHRTYIGLLEGGKRNPSLLIIVKLAKELDCTLSELLGGIK